MAPNQQHLDKISHAFFVGLIETVPNKPVWGFRSTQTGLIHVILIEKKKHKNLNHTLILYQKKENIFLYMAQIARVWHTRGKVGKVNKK